MDKDILAIIGQLYLENSGLRGLVDSLNKKISELENSIDSMNRLFAEGGQTEEFYNQSA